jgi:NADPH:quinone reductase-like Zn-dependent oxidoreductase
MIDYTAGDVIERLQQAPGKPFDVVLDCVTSADPRDSAVDYPARLQGAPGLLADDFVYRRLGGASPDWVRAGLERTVGANCWNNKHEKLFWVRFSKSSDELRQLKEWAEAGKLMPHVSNVYDFTEQGVQAAFDAILSRRVQGKVVVRIRNEESSSQDQSK